ncbi:amidohydrolase family protein [Candidatus Poribacteria bacterium]|nr:amidohydrolase family protein [Candidatus Poribacteria bacterium]
MDNITYFDSCCYLGRHVHMSGDQPETADEIISLMDHFCIHESLVIDVLSRETNPMAGNRRIVERTKDHTRLHPAWAVLMTQSQELPPPKELVAQMQEFDVGALYMFYGQFDIRLDEWGVDDLLEVLEEFHVPVFMCPINWRMVSMDVTDWSNIVRICRKFPQLPVIVTESRTYKSQRAAYAALEACPNLKFDISSWWLHRSIEFICKNWGAERLVWGSQLPERNPGIPMMQLNYSDISHEELSMIASGNMRKMLSWNSSIEFIDNVDFSEPVDNLHKKARERLSLADEDFDDCHGHIGWCTPHHVVHDKPEDLVKEMDKFGIQRCFVFSLEGVFGDETYGNEEVAKVIHQFPDRFIGFTLLNLNHGEKIVGNELQRGLEMGMKGVKLINDYHGYPPEGSLVDFACEFTHEHNLFILNHNWGSPAQIERLCKTYPKACFITGHATKAYAEVTKKVDNLYICTCPLLRLGDAEHYVKIYGADRIMFGSDLTDLPIGWGMAQVLYANISEKDKRLIMGGNMQRLLKEKMMS